MIWSLLRILLFVGFAALVAYVAGILLETDGNLRMIALGYEVTLGPLQAAIFAIVVVVAVWIMLRLSGLLIATP